MARCRKGPQGPPNFHFVAGEQAVVHFPVPRSRLDANSGLPWWAKIDRAEEWLRELVGEVLELPCLPRTRGNTSPQSVAGLPQDGAVLIPLRAVLVEGESSTVLRCSARSTSASSHEARQARQCWKP